MISNILALYNFVNKELKAESVLKALFSWNGSKTTWDKEIKIRLHGSPKKDWIGFMKSYYTQ